MEEEAREDEERRSMSSSVGRTRLEVHFASSSGRARPDDDDGLAVATVGNSNRRETRSSPSDLGEALEACANDGHRGWGRRPRRRPMRREGDAVAGFDAVETSGSTDALANALTRGALDALERGKDFGAFVATTGGERGRERAMEAIVESRAIERTIEGIEGRLEGVPKSRWELSATCAAVGTGDRDEAKDLLEDDEARTRTQGVGGDAHERGVTVASIECARDGTNAFESAAERAHAAFADAALKSTAEHHTVFSLRLKMYASDDDNDTELVTVTRVHVVILAPYVPAPGLFGGVENRDARIRCTRSMTTMMTILRNLGRSAFRQVKIWRDSPLTRLMWGCGMAELQSAMLMVVCDDALVRAVDSDATSPLVFPTETEALLKFALQLKDGTLEETEPSPRTRNPPTPTPTKKSPLVSSHDREKVKHLRTEAPPQRQRPRRSEVRPQSKPEHESRSNKTSKITVDQIDNVVRVIKMHASGLQARRLESTVQNLYREWVQMAHAHENILDDFTALEEELISAQSREDEAVEYAEKLASDLAVTSQWCETLEAEQATANIRVEQAAKDATRVAREQVIELERRVKDLELELVRNSVPEMERVRDESEKSAQEALEKLKLSREELSAVNDALDKEKKEKRELLSEIETLRGQILSMEASRSRDQEEIERGREELHSRFEAESEMQKRMAEAQKERDTEVKRLHAAQVEQEDQFNDMRRQRDDALHKLHLKEEELVDARANMRASVLNVESLQTATNEAKAAQQDAQRELEVLKLRNSDLLVQVKHAKRELEGTSEAVDKLTDKLSDLERDSEEAIDKRRAAENQAHELRRSVTDLELNIKSIEMDKEVAYQAANVARAENAKLTAKVLDLNDEVARLKASLTSAQDAARALLDEEASRLARLAPTMPVDEYVSPAWLHDTSWQQPLAPSS
jgi:hypothetical protein